MVRARLAAYAAVLFLVLTGVAAPDIVPRPAQATGLAPAAAVAWPVSTGLVVAEVVTGGASASDEYIELANIGALDADLAGLEVAYVTASGATVTRKATWAASTRLAPGQRLLLANGLGAFAASADLVYSGGLAATGGAIMVRPIGGSPVDAVGWGDASSAYVEGAAAPAPGAGWSIERLAWTDTNDNAADFLLNAAPVGEGLGAAPMPTPTPGPSASPSMTPAPTVAPSLTPEPTPNLTPEPTPSLTPEPTPDPTPAPTVTPRPTPEPTPSPTPEPTLVAAQRIAEVRALPDGAAAIVEGILTTSLGALEAGRTAFVQDATAGIGVYLDASVADALPAGAAVRVSGTTATRYGQRVLRVAESSIVVLTAGTLPVPITTTSGGAGEGLEGLRVLVRGTVATAPEDLADGLGITVDDGSGPLRVIAAVNALGGASIRTGDLVTAVGPLGQRDSSGTGLAGYRVHATLAGDLLVVPPTPSPTPQPTPSPSVAPSLTPIPAPSIVPSPTPDPTATSSPPPTSAPTTSPSPSPETSSETMAPDIASARLVPVGSRVVVRGVVIAEAGRLGTPSLMVIGDATGGLPVRLRDGDPAPARGTVVEATGVVAAPYGQTELRLRAALVVEGTGDVPEALGITATAAGETTEGRLVRTSGTISAAPTKATSGDITLTIAAPGGATLRVYADASAGIPATSLRQGAVVDMAGIVGQRASRKGALDGYRLWLRDRKDVVIMEGAMPSPTASPAPGVSGRPPSGTGGTPHVSIATARIREGATVTIEGTVTTSRTLLDASGRRAIIEDARGAIELYLAEPSSAIRVGVRVRATGEVGRAWGAPRLRVDAAKVLGSRAPVVHSLRVPPSAATEWRLVRVQGTLAAVRKDGDRWTAELAQGNRRLLVVGVAGSGIPSTALVEGRSATITGIVKRPYPTATDRRYAIVPRTSADIALGASVASPSPRAGMASASAGGQTGAGSAPSSAPDAGPGVTPGGDGIPAPVDVELASLPAHLGSVVRIGGLVTAIATDGFELDDGTATGRVVLEGAASALAALVQPGDAVNATGTPDDREGPVLVVTDPADVVLLGDLGAAGWAATGPGGPPTAELSGTVIGPDTPGMEPIDAALAAAGRPDPALLAAATLGLTAILGIGLAAWLRRRSILQTRRRIAVRIARLGAAATTPPGDAATR